jgi:hypothetical protein
VQILYKVFYGIPRTALGPIQPPIQWAPGALSLGVKQLEYEADHSPPSSAEVKNEWSYTSTPQYVFTAWCLVKHWDNFIFYLYLETFTQHIFLSGEYFVKSTQKCNYALK